MQIPGFLLVVTALGGLLWAGYLHAVWYGSRLELTGGYSCTEEVIHYGEHEMPKPCRSPQKQLNKSEEGASEGRAAGNDTDDDLDPGLAPDSDGPSTLERLAPAIAECFAVILCGYLAGRTGLIRPSEVSGLNKFVGNFVLPALIFLSMANLNFKSVNWGFLMIVYGAKALVFVIVVVVTAAASYPTNLGRAGLYGIFATQSNDFALGYPLVQALYAKTHPDFASYLYLAAPSSLMMLNPVAFVLMELQRTRSASKASAPWWSTGHRVLTGIGTNPVVFMTFLGIVANGVFQQCLPNILEGILRVLGQAFSASALFMLGIQMVGKVKSMRGSAMLVPVLLISIKCFLLPLIIRGLLVHFPPAGEHIRDFQEFGFLLGTFPTAPGVFVFATLYNIDVDMLSSALVACTFLATPFMLLSARMASIGVVNVTEYVSSLRHFVLYTTSVGAATLACVIAVLLVTRKHQRVPYQTTIHLLLAQLLAAIGALFWYSLDDAVPWQLYLKYVMFTLGQFAGRVWAALLAVTLTLVSRYTVGVVRRLSTASLLFGWGLPAVLTVGIFAGGEYEGFELANATQDGRFSVVPIYVKTNPNMGFGVGQIYTNFCVQLVCLIVVIVCLVLHHRYKLEYVTYVSLQDNEGSSASPPPSPPSRSDSVASQTLPSRSRNPSGCSHVSSSPSLAQSESSGVVCTRSDSGVGAAARRPPPRPLLKTRSQLQVEQAYLDEAQRKVSAPELAAAAAERAPKRASRSKSVGERKITAREQLTYSFAVKPSSGGDNWKMVDPRAAAPPPTNAARTERSFSVKKLKKRDSELSTGSVIRCDATGCQLRKKITPVSRPTPEEYVLTDPIGCTESPNEDAVSVASGETDFSSFSSVSHSTASSVVFATRPPSVACSLYNPDSSAMDAAKSCPEQDCISSDTSSVIRDRDEEFHTLRHSLLLISLAWSMVVSMFLCGCSLPVQREGKMGGVYIQLTFIDTIINFGQGVLAFFVLGLDPEAFLMPLRSRWMRLRYGGSCFGSALRRKASRPSDDHDHVCQKFIDFYLEQCIQEIVRDRRVQQKLLHDVFLGTELVDWLLLQGLAGSRRAAVRYARRLVAGGLIEHHQQTYHFHDMPFWYRLTATFREGNEPRAKISTVSTTIVNVD
ncbi:integral membrane protein GPR155-like [Pollicipes pollicipes]|uniref:integral membrane protein GPR155-like n=2 Tax=Pollicipes pollicipes TaxID=41117 RepID=UPI001884D068|nr:integral membrane protein GPR155-like [Pollicipes pollicipes]